MKDWKNFFKKVFFTAMKTLILQTWKQIEFFPYLQCHMQKNIMYLILYDCAEHALWSGCGGGSDLLRSARGLSRLDRLRICKSAFIIHSEQLYRTSARKLKFNLGFSDKQVRLNFNLGKSIRSSFFLSFFDIIPKVFDLRRLNFKKREKKWPWKDAALIFSQNFFQNKINLRLWTINSFNLTRI